MVKRQTLCIMTRGTIITLLLMAAIVGCRPRPTTPQPGLSPVTSPFLSPIATPKSDAGRLLFHSNRAGNYDIYMLDIETGEVSRLTDSPDHEIEPALSPDGTRIAFARTRFNPRGQDIYVMNTEGADPERITYMKDSIAMCPDWSPDGDEIIFYATRASHFHLFAVSPERGEVREIPSSPQNDMMPDWSPDGTRIVFASDREGRGELYVMSPDGSNLQRLTDSMMDEWRPRWSPDGNYIVFQGNYTGHWELYLLNIETGEIERLTDGSEESREPYWSGDGRLIYYAHEEQGGYNLYVLDLEQRISRQLTNTPGVEDGYPVWVGR